MVAQVVGMQAPVLVVAQAMLFDVCVLWRDSLASVTIRLPPVSDDEEEVDGRVHTDGFEKVGEVYRIEGFRFGIPYGDDSDIGRGTGSVFRCGRDCFAVDFKMRMERFVSRRVKSGVVVRRV